MPVRKSKLYNAFGEIIYTLAMADGKVQQIEIETIKDALTEHEWSSGIMWSFDYENEKQRNTAKVLKQALKVFQENGPSDEYYFFIKLLKKVASSSNGIDLSEAELIFKIENYVKQIENQ